MEKSCRCASGGARVSVVRDLRRHQRLLDYGPLGAELKRNVKDLWWNAMIASARTPPSRGDHIMSPAIWKAVARGHVRGYDAGMSASPKKEFVLTKLNRNRGLFIGGLVRNQKRQDGNQQRTSRFSCVKGKILKG